MNRRWDGGSRAGIACTDGDGHWRPNRKNVVRPARREVVAFEVDDPQLVESTAEGVAHAAEAGAADIRRRGDETDNGRPAAALQDRPQRPAPEVDIIVVDIFGVDPVGGSCWQKVIQD